VWVSGKIIHVDRFGNLITNINPAMLRQAFPRRNSSALAVECGGHDIQGVRETYSDVAVGQPLALFGSYGLIEISVRDADASAVLKVGCETPVTIKPTRIH
jgi:hypothetical protein